MWKIVTAPTSQGLCDGWDKAFKKHEITFTKYYK